jgi:hypothetical protein
MRKTKGGHTLHKLNLYKVIFGFDSTRNSGGSFMIPMAFSASPNWKIPTLTESIVLPLCKRLRSSNKRRANTMDIAIGKTGL